MAVYQRETRRRPILLIVAITALVLVTLDSRGNSIIDSIRSVAREALQPIQSVVDSAFSPVRDAVQGITDYGNVKDENAQLKKELAELRGKQLRERAVGSEVGELEKLLDLPTIEDATGVTARVVSGAPGNFERTVIVNKGTSSGVDVGQPVVVGDGLIGKVTAATGPQATVTLMDDASFGVGVRLENSNDRGIAEGRTGEQEMRLNFLTRRLGKCNQNAPKDSCITKGELVFTSAVENAAFPPDIPVGKVASVTKSQGDLEPTVLVTPLADLEHITYVKVLRYPEPKGG
jgi:rod shape-determining protein MreC